MSVVFEKTKLLTDKQFHYCPGCNHGIIHRLVAEVIDEMNLDGKVIGVAPVGCSVFAYDYFNCDMYEAAHGRAPAVATGAKRVVGKDTLVFTYQGDGDLASIGTAEIVHAAHRGEKISTIFVNNAIYGMTGGQMAPTTLVGQKTTTSPYGRDEDWCGAPLKVSEMLAEVPCSYYIERVAVNNTPNIVKAKKAISKAFHYQMEGKGFTLVEVLSACPTNWGLEPLRLFRKNTRLALPESVNALFYIPHQKQIVFAAQLFHDCVLHPVYVLKLVHENHIVSAAKLPTRLFVVKQGQSKVLQIVVVQQIFFAFEFKKLPVQLFQKFRQLIDVDDVFPTARKQRFRAFAAEFLRLRPNKPFKSVRKLVKPEKQIGKRFKLRLYLF